MHILKFIYHLFFLLIFGLSIAVQYNDPDPTLWIVLYFLPILIGGLHLVKIPVRPYALGLAIAYTIYAVLIFPGLIPDPFNNEEFREAGGLLICVLYLVSLVAAKPAPASRKPS